MELGLHLLLFRLSCSCRDLVNVRVWLEMLIFWIFRRQMPYYRYELKNNYLLLEKRDFFVKIIENWDKPGLKKWRLWVNLIFLTETVCKI